MEHLINPLVREIQISGIRRFSALVANYPDAISLTIGQPDFPTPEHVKAAAIQAITDNRTVYTANAGMPALLQAASAFFSQKYGLVYDAAEEIITTIGASEAIDIALRSILVPGSEVILPGPVYPGYEPIIRLCGAIPIHVDTRQHGFRMTADLVRPHLSAKTRCVILPYPSNPTGTVLSEPDLANLAALLSPQNLIVLSDEIYSELVYDGHHGSIAKFPGMREKTIVINGLSKSHAMTGWRIGFTLAPAALSQHLLKVHQYNATCASSISQYAALEALTAGADDALEMRDAYRDRRNYVVGRLNAMGLPTEVPGGAFYVFPEVTSLGLSSMAFATALLHDGRVAVIPGDAFSSFGEGHVRLSYAYAPAVLEAGLDGIEAFVRERRARM